MIKIKYYLGYTDAIKEPRKTKVENLLDENCHYAGVYMKVKEFLLNVLAEKGSHIDKKESVITYNARTGEPNKPKDKYSLYTVKGTFYELRKTEYDFLQYCISNGLTESTKIGRRDKEDDERKETEKRKREEDEQREKEEENRKKAEADEIESNFWDQLDSLSEREIRIANNIYMDKYGKPASGRNLIFIFYVRNIDNPICRGKVMSWLSSNGNVASIQLFECVTGAKLPKGMKNRLKFLETFTSADIVGFQEYKPRKKPEKREVELQEFYKYKGNLTGWVKTRGELVSKYGLKFFVTKEEKDVFLYTENGIPVCSGESKTAVLKRLKKLIDDKGIDGFEKQVKRYIEITKCNEQKRENCYEN